MSLYKKRRMYKQYNLMIVQQIFTLDIFPAECSQQISIPESKTWK